MMFLKTSFKVILRITIQVKVNIFLTGLIFQFMGIFRFPNKITITTYIIFFKTRTTRVCFTPRTNFLKIFQVNSVTV
ncbi:hypothetical protein Hanom_Chr08g00711781 [Helianthus anomalus]